MTLLPPVDRLKALCPINVQSLLESVKKITITEYDLEVDCESIRSRNALHEQIDPFCVAIAYYWPGHIVRLKAKNSRAISKVALPTEDPTFYPDTLEAKSILQRRIRYNRICEFIVQISPNVVFVLDQDGIILDSNATKQNYWIDRADLIGKKLTHAPNVDESAFKILRAAKRGRAYQFQIERDVCGVTVRFAGTSQPCNDGTIVICLEPQNPLAVRQFPFTPFST